METRSEPSYILYETPEPGIARIVLNRPETANAQDTRFLYQLNDAFDRAAHDEDIRVIILAANGKHFSSGHDLGEKNWHAAMHDYATVGTMCGFTCAGAEAQMSREEEIYVGFSERWRNIPKPTIAAVQGKCIAGGLMLAWPCDLIIATEDASFSDPTVSFGVGGVEYFTHLWEVGARKAKEMLFTSDALSAQDALRLGMVNQVVPRAELDSTVLAMAGRIAAKPAFALAMAKQAVNQTLDIMGQQSSIDAAFGLHHLCHAHNKEVFGTVVDPGGVPAAVKR